MNVVDPLPGESGKRGEVLVNREPLGLEPPHLAGQGRIALDGLAADDPAHRRITPQPVGVVDVFISGKPTEHRLAQHAHQIVATVPARARVNQVLARDGHHAKRGIEFAISQQPASEVTLEPWNSSLRRRLKSSRRASDSASPAGCAIIASIQ
jgi:hypothetical protein